MRQYPDFALDIVGRKEHLACSTHKGVTHIDLAADVCSALKPAVVATQSTLCTKQRHGDRHDVRKQDIHGMHAVIKKLE